MFKMSNLNTEGSAPLLAVFLLQSFFQPCHESVQVEENSHSLSCRAWGVQTTQSLYFHSSVIQTLAFSRYVLTQESLGSPVLTDRLLVAALKEYGTDRIKDPITSKVLLLFAQVLSKNFLARVTPLLHRFRNISFHICNPDEV